MLFEVGEQIRLDDLRKLLGAQPEPRQPAFKHPAPDYVRFEQAPAVEHLEPLTLSSGERFERRVKYFDYGVVSVELQMGFETGWEELVRLSARWITGPEIERSAAELVRGRVERYRSAVVQPFPAHLDEDYYIIQLNDALAEDGSRLDAETLLRERGCEIARIVRGESIPLSASEKREALEDSLSYYPNDLMVVGWVAALVYDTPEGAAASIQLLEYANTQLLEYRHYDDLLTRLLSGVYDYLERPGGLSRRWKTAGEAEKLNTILLDIRELTERTDNAIKFLSDMFYARAYKVAAERVGVIDYRDLVEEKLRTAGELYEFMVNQFHQGRAFVLEAMVVAILIIELVKVLWPR